MMVLAAKRQEAYEEVWEALPRHEQPVRKRRRRLRLHPMILLSLLAVLMVVLTALGISQKIKAIELEYQLQSLEAELSQV
ncbi:MAG: hypothetical protein GX977_11865 [Firmicutes bacterium]|nr:hypothetical protein [Bacillota bacterium]